MSEGDLDPNWIAHEVAVGRVLTALRCGGERALAEAAGRGIAPSADGGFTLEDAETVYAKRHGFDDWRSLRARLDELSRDGDPDPPLVRAVGARDVDEVRRLIGEGADVTERGACGCTALHRAGYGHPPELAPGPQAAHAAIIELLLDAGAPVDLEAHGSGGTPLAMALFWGHTTLAARLAREGVFPDNLRTAAALDRADDLARFFDGDSLRPGAGERRGFYRPHDEFIEATFEGTTQEVLDDALLWAARAGALNAMRALVDRGANVDAATYQGPPLMGAVSRGPLAAARWLLDEGADVDARGTFPRGATALHMAAASARLDHVELLLERGADPSIEDFDFGSTPGGYAEWGGAEDVAARLNS